MAGKKIFNDPVYGFISLPHGLLLNLADHPFFQRLTRIRQLGLTCLVYPGAFHTRFHHALGACHLMTQAIETIRSKGHDITAEEADALCCAILLHDIGHGPFSHALEAKLINGLSHETATTVLMQELNNFFNGKLNLALSIFNGTYSRKFMRQLVSSQLDMDRMDYLNRDSFFTGVSEGVISSDRIIKMLEVKDGSLAVEIKGIYSVEKFLIARRLMYWQVYLHKTVLAAEHMLVKIIDRARLLARSGEKLFATPVFSMFLENTYHASDFAAGSPLIGRFAALDDFDIMASVKAWAQHPDPVLSILCRGLVNRNLFKVKLQATPFDPEEVDQLQRKAVKLFNISEKDLSCFVFTDRVENKAYNVTDEKINILMKDGSIKDVADASDNLNLAALSSPVTKYFLWMHPALKD